MKPITLEMHAFGPYGDRAMVDFEPLADVGLFVVSGPTGAGKSTIFDAICFGLYGSLSGARASHNDVRSHYAEPHAKCTVVLVFDAEGQRWRVTRQPSQTVQKQRGSGTTVQPATAVLEHWNGTGWEPDTTKVRDVTARCRELVGLSLEQFERVVLLPQGKFAEVLNAKTSERSELLRTLFGSEVFDRAADILAEQAKEGERSLQGVNEQRAVFHQRAVDAIERVEAAIADLPADAAAIVASGHERPDAVTETQLSLLEPAPEVEDPGGVLVEDDPVVDLDALVHGPVARLTALVERRRLAAEVARTERDRAESQRRAIDQRIETLRLLGLLEAKADEMQSVASRTSTGRKLLGLLPALADRQARREQLQQAEQAMSNLWLRSQSLLAGALPGDADDISAATLATSALVSDLLDRVATRTAALDLVAQERQRTEQLRRERSSLADRLAHLDAIEERAQAEVSTTAAEVASLTEEDEQLQLVASQQPKLVDQISSLNKLLVTRQRADQSSVELDRFVKHRSAIETDVAAGQRAIAVADTEIVALSLLADDVEIRRQAAATTQRRCVRRSELDRATAKLNDAAETSQAAKAAADATFASFVGQTAPRLAAQLVDDEPCPVCGSCDHPAPAGDDMAHAGLAIDAAAVERASASASAADAEQSRWRTTVANLIEEDPQLSMVDVAELADANTTAASALAAAEKAIGNRDQMRADRSVLQVKVADLAIAVEQANTDVAGVQLALRELEGALGEAATRTEAELQAERRSVAELQVEADAAVGRLAWIKARRADISQASADAERLSRQRAVDRATAAERIGQLATTIATGDAQFAAMLDGEDLSTRRDVVQSLRSALAGWQEHALAVARIEAAHTSIQAQCALIVADAGFDDEEAAVAAALPAATLEQLEASHGRWSHELAAHHAALATYAVQELPDERPDLEVLTATALAAADLHREVGQALTTIEQAVLSARADLVDVAALDAAHAEQRSAHETLQRVAHVVRGQNSRRLSLENWVLSVYLHDVVEHANLHLSTMSNGRYRLAVQDAPSSQVGQHGLDLVVDDAHTGRMRSSMSLSGGETFQASLALALGLADVVMLGRAGLHLDALFVDEGFGSLDADAIDQAITVLDGLRSRGSMVGVITHVEALKNALPVAIDVQPRSDHRGSEIRQVA